VNVPVNIGLLVQAEPPTAEPVVVQA